MSNGPLYAMGGAHPHALENRAELQDLIEEARRLCASGDFRGLDLFDFVSRIAELELADGLTGFATGRKSSRKQEILTPESIADFARLVFGGQIVLDPCAAVDEEGNQRGFVQALDFHGGAERGSTDGLAWSWTDKTYVNPPFKYLKKWLVYATEQAQRGLQILVLAPQRPHRPWFRMARDVAQRDGFVLELNGVKFVGYGSAFPAPLCLMGFNCELTNEVFEAGKQLGEFM